MKYFWITTLLLLLPLSASGRGRIVAVLEYRAGVRAAQRIATGMAQSLEQLTSHTVISPADARRKLGASVDAQVAKCMGQAPCMARIGRRLGCDEVVLIGISQLGDLILAIQRIDTRDGKVIARLADSLSAGRTVREKALHGYLSRLFPPSDFKRYGKIIVKTEASGDAVYLDEMFRGKTPLPPLTVSAPGRYTIQVKRSGHVDFVARLDVLPDATVEVTPKMSRETPPLRWYHRWWVWTLVGGIVAGTASAFAVITLSSGSDTVPAVIRFE